jgi:hypothetical protein
MQEEFNPYAAPTASTMHPRAAQWLRSTDDPSLQKVAQGLGLLYNGTLTVIAGIILGIILLVVAGVAAGPGGAMMMMVILAFVLLAAFIMIIVGTLMCLATPEETGAKGLIVASVALYAVGICLSLLGGFTNSQLAQSAGVLASLGGNISFLLFLKQLSQFIGATELVERAKLLLILLAVNIGLQLISVVGALAGAAAIRILALAIIVIGLISLVLYLRLLNSLRQAIQSGGERYF